MSVTYLEPFGVNTSANYTFANILVTANITNNGNVNFIGASNVSLGSNATVRISGGSSGGVLTTNGSGGLTWSTQVANALVAGTVYTNAQPNITSVGSLNSLTVTGLITATGTGLKAANIQDSSGTITITTKYNSVSGDVGIYGNLNVGTSGTGFFIGDGGYISNITSGNITGQVANAVVAGTVYTNAQPNITSVGTLTTLTSGTHTISANANVSMSGALSRISGANLVSANYLTATANGNISMSGTLSQISGANLISGTYLTGTLTTAAQPNITSVGSLSALTVSGDATVTGNFTVGGNTTYINVETFRVEDPLIELGGGVNGAALTSNDSKDRGTILHYYTTEVVDAFMGWDNSNAEFAFGSNVSVSSEVVTFNRFGNIRANYFIGNGSELTGITATTGNANYANFAGTVVNAIQSNITSVGTLINTTLGSANSFTGGNLVSATYLTGTLTTAAQPNVTSVGTLATVTHAANANVTMSGSLSQISGPNLVSANYVTTTANGNILMSGTLSQISGANLISGTYLTGTLTTAAQPNVTSVGTMASITLAANANVTMSGSLSQISGPNLVSANYVTTTANGNILMSGTLSRISGANLISGTYLTGTLTTAIQGNITSVGTLASLGVTGTTTSGNFATAGNITASFLVSNVATGTAPFTVTSTTRVANLNVAYANVSDYSAISTASTGNYYLNMVNALTGNVQEYANASLVANATSGTFYSNNAALTNNLYTKYLTVSSISQESFSTITSATGIVVHNVSNGPTFYHTTPSANFTPNFTNVTVTANTTTIVSLIIVQGATPYMPTATANIQIEGANNTINWLFGVAPIGTASKIDIVNFSLVRTSSAWTVLGQAATFG